MARAMRRTVCWLLGFCPKAWCLTKGIKMASRFCKGSDEIRGAKLVLKANKTGTVSSGIRGVSQVAEESDAFLSLCELDFGAEKGKHQVMRDGLPKYFLIHESWIPRLNVRQVAKNVQAMPT